MSSQDLTTAKYLPTSTELIDAVKIPQHEPNIPSPVSLGMLSGGVSIVLALILLVVGGYWCYSGLQTAKKAAEEQQASSELSLFDVVSCVFGSEHGKQKIEKCIQRLQEDRIADIQREFDTEESREMRRQLQDAPAAMERMRQQITTFPQNPSSPQPTR